MKIEKVTKVKGELFLPGDKSISHRAIMFSSLAKGKSIVSGFLKSEDIFSTINCFRNLGCEIEEKKNELIITGCGFRGFSKPNQNLDCGNSGTTTRLISGILAAQNFNSTLTGDESLSKRPMKRVIEPLQQMGAKFNYSIDFKLPIEIIGTELNAIKYELKVASAQVKSCLILAALHVNQTSEIIESVDTRNHTENMLGLNVQKTAKGNVISVSSKDYPSPKEYKVPADISSAAFFIILTLCLKNSELIIRNISLNKSRTGVISVLQKMGGDISIINNQVIAGEEFGDILVRSSKLKNIEIPKEMIPNIIDEIPILSVAGFFAEGNLRIEHAEELRYKESDRISAIVENFRNVGCEIAEYKDGFEIMNKVTKNHAVVKSYNDHRIAMAFAVMSMLSDCSLEIDSVDCVKISNPEYFSQLKTIIN